MTLPVCLLIASCASQGSIKVDSRPVHELLGDLAQPPADLTEPCSDPVDLRGFQSLNAGPVERLWFQDRSSLVICKSRNEGLKGFYRGRDAALAGAK
jgi:hypothetical protein